MRGWEGGGVGSVYGVKDLLGGPRSTAAASPSPSHFYHKEVVTDPVSPTNFKAFLNIHSYRNLSLTGLETI